MPNNSNGDRLWTVLREIPSSLTPPASLVVDDAAREALRRDAGLMLPGETMVQFVKRVREALKAHNAVNGDFVAGAAVKDLAQQKIDGLGFSLADVAGSVGLSVAELDNRAAEAAAASVLASAGASAGGRGRRQADPSAVAMALDEVFAVAVNEPAAKEAARLLTPVSPALKDAEDAAAEDIDEYLQLIQDALKALRTARRDVSTGERACLSRLIGKLGEAVRTGRKLPEEDLTACAEAIGRVER